MCSHSVGDRFARFDRFVVSVAVFVSVAVSLLSFFSRIANSFLIHTGSNIYRHSWLCLRSEICAGVWQGRIGMSQVVSP